MSIPHWPARMHYVCNSGQHNIINISPIVQAGADKVTGVTILCAVHDRTRPTAAERRFSLEPAARLRRYLTEHLGLDSARVHEIDGGQDSYLEWTPALHEPLERASAENSELVYNITGGVRNAAWGAVFGLPPETRSRLTLISVAQSDRRCKILRFNVDGMLAEEHELPPHARVGLADYLAIYGFREVEPEERSNADAYLTRAAPIATRMLQFARKGGRVAISRMHDEIASGRCKIGRPDQDHIRIRPDDFGKQCQSIAALIRILDDLEGVRIVEGNSARPELRAEDSLAKRFLGGGWMEAAVLSAVRSVTEGVSGVEVFGGVAYEQGNGSQTNEGLDTIGEFDVILMIDDQPHFIEVKAATQSPGSFGPAMSKLVEKRGTLSAQQCRAWMIAPLLSMKPEQRQRWSERARALGIGLIFGRDSIERLQGQIGAMLKGRS